MWCNTGIHKNSAFDLLACFFVIKHLLRFSDTGADKKLREEAYRGADIVLVCFPVTELKQDVQVLVNELRFFTKEVAKDKIVLVGTKSDLKDDETSSTKGWNIVRELSARVYLECSSTEDQNSMKNFAKRIIDVSIQRTKQTGLLGDINKRR